MSLGYAEKLSFREDLGGQLGAPEHFDSPEEVERKVTHLAHLVAAAQRIVVFTGAGISTSTGIPDFRGPNGIWTLQRQGKPLPHAKVPFWAARPSFTHAALAQLVQEGKVTYIVSQNVDGLHLRSGIPREKLAELHGNCFAERCSKCCKEYIRDFEMETVGFKKTGRVCTVDGCNGKLHDHVLDWEDALPEDELEASEEHAKRADLAICLGTSLQITPACNLPLKTIRKFAKAEPGKLVIVNLQRTQHDNKAEKSGGVVIRAKSDEVMQILINKLCINVPPYLREDSVFLWHRVETRQEDGMQILTVGVKSVHGNKCDMPMIQSVKYQRMDAVDSLPDKLATTFAANGTYCVGESWRRFELSPAVTGKVCVRVSLFLQDQATDSKLERDHVVDLDGDMHAGEKKVLWKFVSQEVKYAEATAQCQGIAPGGGGGDGDDNEDVVVDNEPIDKKPRII